ncbi:class A beta-lactamase, subclass A2 [Myroides guanonis]|uniref:Beta-lactamase n=1 Tax=Myroides guanonis TaxID=1150112 RepID=A0A1I3QLD4_9FLAO|nr:class A beta-lactamase, subclass A2 [Myroides guanonis]SFJ34650.1 beta-lactamase class A [Myroides guanonis]
MRKQIKLSVVALAAFFMVSVSANAQEKVSIGIKTQANSTCYKIEKLRDSIEAILRNKNAVVGVAINGMNESDSLSIHGSRHFPMQSVFKFPIALTMLSEIDKGNFSLGQKVAIHKNELLPDLWSPIRDKHPEGATLTIAEILRYTVMMSDNVGCDVLLRLLEKPEVVENYIHKKGFNDFAVKINEEVMQNNWDLQFLNWTTPTEANNILRVFYENIGNQLSKRSYDFIWNVMKETETGKDRLKGQLPKGTIVAHKTGWSGINKETGVSAAVNDIGVVFLPNGNHFYISVFVADSKEDTATNEKIIADITRLAWDYFINNGK